MNSQDPQHSIDKVYPGAIFRLTEKLYTARGRVVGQVGDKVYCTSNKIRNGRINAMVIDSKFDGSRRISVSILSKSRQALEQ